MKSGSMRRRAVFGLAIATAISAAVASGATAWAATPAEGEIVASGSAQVVPNNYIVVLKEDSRSVDQMADALTSKFGGRVKHRYKTALRGFSIAEMSETQARRLAADPAVAYVQRNGILRKTDVQDPAIWNLARIDQRDRADLTSYEYPNTASSVHAYVIDSGIRITHEHFGGRAVWGTNTTGDGYDYDCSGHGTHVAGTLGGDDYGVAKEVQLVAVKVLTCDGSGTDEGVAAGIDWVTANAVKPAVANMSLGGGGSHPVVEDAVRRSIASGIVYSVAAGNGDDDGNPLDACGSSPASVRDAITVSATDRFDEKAYWANYGKCVDLFAPGVDILSSISSGDSSYTDASGTSMAAPHVAGAAALILHANPDATPEQVRFALGNAATANVVGYPGPGSPNLMLYVRNTPSPVIASSTIGLYNPRFGSTEVYAITADNKAVYKYWSGRWSDWKDLGGNIVGNPALLYNPRFGSTEVYARTVGNTLAYRYYSNGWSDWIDLGGNIAGDPAVLYNPRFGSTEVYARSADNKVVYKYWSGGWSDWKDLGGDVAGDPVLLYNPRFKTTEAYVRTSTNQIQYKYYSNGWSDWNDLGGNAVGDPALLYNPRFGSTEVYVRTAENKLAYRYYSNGWSGWKDLGGDIADDPALLYNPKYRTTEVYVRTSANQIQYRYYYSGWSAWKNLEGNMAGSPFLLFNPRFNSTEIYSKTQSNHAAYRYYAGGWSTWFDLSM